MNMINPIVTPACLAVGEQPGEGGQNLPPSFNDTKWSDKKILLTHKHSVLEVI